MEFLKFILLFLILILCTSIGFLMAKKYTDRVKELIQFSNLINILKNKIKFTHKPLTEIFMELSKIGKKSSITKMFEKVSLNLKNNTFEKSWNDAIESTKDMNLNKEDIDVIKTLSALLGKTDIEGQMSEINQFSLLIETRIKNAEELSNKNAKMYRSLGAIIGVAILIIGF